MGFNFLYHYIIMTHLAYLPFSHKSIAIGTRKYMRGRGMGSVLLNRGGAGSASAYGSVGEYTETTGVNPYASGRGRGLGSISKKLESLSIAPKKLREKNINFNL
jgi:hypothetical protein